MSKKGNPPPPRPVGNGGQHYSTSTGTADSTGEFHFNLDEARGGFTFKEKVGNAYTRARAQEQARRRRGPPPQRTRAVCPHSVLGVECDAPLKDLRSAYRALAKSTHPDLGLPEEREERTKRMVRLNRAYSAAAQERQ